MIRPQLILIVAFAFVSFVLASEDLEDDFDSENLVAKMSIGNLLDNESSTTIIFNNQEISVANDTLDFRLPIASHQMDDTAAEVDDGFESQFYQSATRLGSYTMMTCVGLACLLLLLVVTNCFLCFAFFVGYGQTISYELPR
jgi:hypothetical protein